MRTETSQEGNACSQDFIDSPLPNAKARTHALFLNLTHKSGFSHSTYTF